VEVLLMVIVEQNLRHDEVLDYEDEEGLDQE
jgi:hypothetical protein